MKRKRMSESVYVLIPLYLISALAVGIFYGMTH